MHDALVRPVVMRRCEVCEKYAFGKALYWCPCTRPGCTMQLCAACYLAMRHEAEAKNLLPS